MAMSTQTWDEAARLQRENVLVDSVQVYNLGSPVTTGVHVSLSRSPVGEPIPALVQTTTLANAAESSTDSVYSVKVAQGTALSAGQAVKVLSCRMEPSLVGKTLLLDKVSQNGLAALRKAVASDFEVVNQEGQEGL